VGLQCGGVLHFSLRQFLPLVRKQLLAGGRTVDKDSPEWIDYRTARPSRFTRHTVRSLPAHNEVSLSAAEADAILQAATGCPGNPYVPSSAEEFIQEAQRASSDLFTPSTRKTVQDILDSGFGALLLENIPMDPVLPPTPGACGPLSPDYKRTFVSEFVSVAISTLVDAQIFNFRQEGRGSAPLFDNVVPVRQLQSQRGAGGFENNFPFHSESAWHRMRPDYVALIGIRKEPEAKTLVCSITDMLDQEIITNMPEDSYRLKPPELYTQMEEQGVPLGTPFYRACPPIDASGDAATISVNLNGTDCLGHEAVEWLGRFESVVESSAIASVLEPGNALILNNNRTCHTRTGFDPGFGPDARWFLRGNYKKDLWEGDLASRRTFLLDADLEMITEYGWADDSGNLATSFLPFIENPQKINELPDDKRLLAAKALYLTPVRGSRIV
jgi:L-asparagine oxygenase